MLHSELNTMQINRYIRKYDGPKYLALFRSDEKHDRIFDRIRYLIMLKSNVSDVYFQKCTKTKINLDDNLSLEKTTNIEDLVILFKTSFNENHNPYHYEKFLEKYSYKQYIKCYIMKKVNLNNTINFR